jgi:hypothetical protein
MMEHEAAARGNRSRASEKGNLGPMHLTLLAKWIASGGSGCPSVYATDDPKVMVIQGNVLDSETRANLQQVLDGEDAVAIPTETILRAAKLIEGR